MMDNGLNPMRWQRRHLVTWAALVACGGVGGLIFGWFVSPFSRSKGADTATMIVTWLHFPMAYWPYVAAGAVTAGLAYYSADLLTGAR
jgi:hypothetical protein